MSRDKKKQQATTGTRKAWRKRQAVQIASMLPEDATEAGKVLKQTRKLLRTFVAV